MASSTALVVAALPGETRPEHNSRPPAAASRRDTAAAARRNTAVRDHLAEAAALEASGEVWAAAGCFKKALALEPSSALAVEGVDRVDTRQLQVRAQLGEAHSLEQQNNLLGAVGAYRKVLLLDPACLTALEAVDRLRMDPRLGAVDGALQAISSAGSGDKLIERVLWKPEPGAAEAAALAPSPSPSPPRPGAAVVAAGEGGGRPCEGRRDEMAPARPSNGEQHSSSHSQLAQEGPGLLRRRRPHTVPGPQRPGGVRLQAAAEARRRAPRRKTRQSVHCANLDILGNRLRPDTRDAEDEHSSSSSWAFGF